MPKNGPFKTWSLRSNSVTRQVNFNRTKIGRKCQNATFWVIFKECELNSERKKIKMTMWWTLKIFKAFKMADTVKTLVELHPNYFYKTWYCLPLHNSRQQTTLYSDAARKKHVRRCKFKVKSHRNTSLDLVVPFLKATELDHHHLENNGQCLHWSS